MCATAKPGGVSNGICTLRAASMEANHWLGGGATIRFASALNGVPVALTIPSDLGDGEATGDLNIDQTMQVLGNGVGQTIIDGLSANDRVFHIATGAVVKLSGLTIQRGSTGLPSTPIGGGLVVEFGGALALDRSAVISNTSAVISNTGGALLGGDREA